MLGTGGFGWGITESGVLGWRKYVRRMVEIKLKGLTLSAEGDNIGNRGFWVGKIIESGFLGWGKYTRGMVANNSKGFTLV